MRQAVADRLESFAESYADLAESLPAEAYRAALPGRSNDIGSQFWCVVGGRESYAAAISEGKWLGFSCSLPGAKTGDRTEVVAALRRSAQAVAAVVGEVGWTGEREQFLLTLLEHEAQHQGQLIRFVYAFGYTFPESWKSRWALSD